MTMQNQKIDEALAFAEGVLGAAGHTINDRTRELLKAHRDGRISMNEVLTDVRRQARQARKSR